MRIYTLFLTLIALTFSVFSYANKEENFFHASLAKQKTLEIQIPPTFKLGHKESGRQTSSEFIPKNEDINNWNEIVTVSQISECSELMTLMSTMQTQKGLSDSPANILMNDIKFQKENDILTGLLTIDGPSFLVGENVHKQLEGTNEIVLTKAIEGKGEVWMVQYTIRYPKNKTKNKDKAKLIQKIENFFDQNITIKDS
ncbi:MAG: hypothetical protein K940chlam6_00662 [Chlamydiae bacterium]|nr:hypothetical protein [Chlamydiota bacterium]